MSLENPSDWHQVTQGSSARLLGRELTAQMQLGNQVRAGAMGKQKMSELGCRTRSCCRVGSAELTRLGDAVLGDMLGQRGPSHELG
jgi:hypothetical protein